MQNTIAEAVDFIVFIAKVSKTVNPSGRQVEELLRVIDYDGTNYITQLEG
jgi:type IV secretion system protein VirB11